MQNIGVWTVTISDNTIHRKNVPNKGSVQYLCMYLSDLQFTSTQAAAGVHQSADKWPILSLMPVN